MTLLLQIAIFETYKNLSPSKSNRKYPKVRLGVSLLIKAQASVLEMMNTLMLDHLEEANQSIAELIAILQSKERMTYSTSFVSNILLTLIFSTIYKADPDPDRDLEKK